VEGPLCHGRALWADDAVGCCFPVCVAVAVERCACMLQGALVGSAACAGSACVSLALLGTKDSSEMRMH
jgi:hypothetical protein